jgi:hypothetical protein
MRVDISKYDLHITSTAGQKRIVFVDDEQRIWTYYFMYTKYGECKCMLDALIARGYIEDEWWETEVPVDSPAYVLDEFEKELDYA